MSGDILTPTYKWLWDPPCMVTSCFCGKLKSRGSLAAVFLICSWVFSDVFPIISCVFGVAFGRGTPKFHMKLATSQNRLKPCLLINHQFHYLILCLSRSRPPTYTVLYTQRTNLLPPFFRHHGLNVFFANSKCFGTGSNLGGCHRMTKS